MKKLLLVFSVVLFATLVVQSQTAFHKLTLADVAFDVTTGTITSYTGNAQDIAIPDSIQLNDGTKVAVRFIGQRVFKDATTSIKGVDFSQATNLDSIGIQAFHFKPRLGDLDLSGAIRLTKIKNSAFDDAGLTSVILPTSLMEIEQDAFTYNTNEMKVLSLTSVTLPQSVKEGYEFIGWFASDDSDNPVTEITNLGTYPSLSHTARFQLIHELTIADVDFDETTGTITSYKGTAQHIAIPDRIAGIPVITIGKDAFSLATTKIASVDFSRALFLSIIENSAFQNLDLESVDLHNNYVLKFVGENTFNGNNFSSITLPTIINQNAKFDSWHDQDYNMVTEITNFEKSYLALFHESYILTINDVDFDATTGTISNYKGTAQHIAIPDSIQLTDGTKVAVKVIGDNTFSLAATKIASVDFLSATNLVKIGKSAFFDLSLGELDISGATSLISIDEKAFEATKLIYVLLPRSLNSIGQGAFSDATGLTSIDLPISKKDGYSFAGWFSSADNDNPVTEITNLDAFPSSSYAARFQLIHELTLADVDFDAITGTISNYKGTAQHIAIPDSIQLTDGTKVAVKVIGDNTFSLAATKIASVDFLSATNLVRIGKSAFFDLSLGELDISGATSLTSIDEKAFEATKLIYVLLPRSLNSIGQGAFSDVTGITSIDLPISKKDGYSFAGWFSSADNDNPVTEITNLDAFPSSSYAARFQFIHELTLADVDFDETTGTITSYKGTAQHIAIPDSIQLTDGTKVAVKVIEDNTFSQAATKIASVDFLSATNLVRIGKSAFFDLSLGELDLYGATSLISIDEKAFENAMLTSVTLPISLNSIGQGAFLGVTGLTSIDLPISEKEEYEFIGWFASDDSDNPVTQITDFTTDSGLSYSAQFETSQGEDGVHELTIADVDFDETTRTISNYKGTAQHIAIPDSIQLTDGTKVAVKIIGDNTFSLATTKIASVYFSKATNLDGIGVRAFASLNLGDLDLSKATSLISIDEKAFENAMLTSVTIPVSLNSIGQGAFLGVTGLTSIDLPISEKEGYEFIGWFASDDSDNPVTQITDFTTDPAPSYSAQFETSQGEDGVHEITIADVDFDETTRTISNYKGTAQHIAIPDSIQLTDGTKVAVKVIGDNTFSLAATKIASVDFSKATNLDGIGVRAFASLNLGDLDLSKATSLISIDEKAFEDAMLTSVTIPVSLNSIGQGAFLGVTGLTSIDLPTSEKEEYEFIGWFASDDSDNPVTQITDFTTDPAPSYSARFSEKALNFTISGTITNLSAIATITVTRGADVTTIEIDPSTGGEFSLEVEKGETIVLTPILEGYTFSPHLLQFTNISESKPNLKFVATKAEEVTSIKADSKFVVEVYPNPVSNELNISGATDSYSVLLMTINGDILEDRNADNNSTTNIDMSAQPAGIYILQISSESNTNRYRIIRE